MIPLIMGTASVVASAIFGAIQSLSKFALIVVALGTLGTSFYHMFRIYTDIYIKIQEGIDGIGVNYGGLIGCAIKSLGMDQFMTSQLAIFVSASIFWGTSVAYILTYRVTRVAYRYMFRATS